MSDTLTPIARNHADATTFNGGGNGVTGSVSNFTQFDPQTEGSGNHSIANLTVGDKWGGSTFGNAVSLTYSFSSASSAYNYSGADATGVLPLVAAQMTGATTAMNAYAAVANITFSGVTDSASLAGDIRWNNTSSTTVGTAYASYPTTVAVGGDIWFGPNYSAYQNPVVGGYGYYTFIHELGHAMGLNHPHESSTAAQPHEDQIKYSVMSYRGYDGQDVNAGLSTAYYPTTLMINDIQAIQFLYGVNTSFHNSDDVYSWASNAKVFETIWDGGGNDTLSAVGQTQACSLYLTSGKWSQIGVAFSNGQSSVRDNLTIAWGAVIENAIGSAFADTIEGNAVANTLDGGNGNDSIDGGTGNDTLIGGAGNDALTGGIGIDTADYASASAAVTAELWRGTASNDGQSGADTLSGIENLSGGGFNDLLGGDESANVLSGQGGNDSIFAGGGNDTVLGGAANDFLSGGAGNDSIDGGAGNDTADYGSASVAVTAELWRGTASNDGQGGNDVLVGIENLSGGGFADLLGGDEAANNLNGQGGDDKLFGGGGNDTLIGGLGNDLLAGGAGNDSINGGGGTDTADYASASTGVTAEIWRGTASNDGQGGNDVLVGIENLSGGALNDLLGGDESANLLSGQGGNDSLFGGGGNDTLLGGAANDFVAGGAGNDSLDGGAGNDTADYASASTGIVAELWRGTASNDGQGGNDILLGFENLNGGGFNDLLGGDEAANILNGLGGNDNIYAGGGNDMLNGGLGNDNLFGGNGQDTFRFDTTLNAATNRDTLDFVVADDIISLASGIFSAIGSGALAAGKLRAGAGVSSALDADDFILYNSTDGALYYDADGSGAGAAVQFAILPVGLALTQANFIVS